MKQIHQEKHSDQFATFNNKASLSKAKHLQEKSVLQADKQSNTDSNIGILMNGFC